MSGLEIVPGLRFGSTTLRRTAGILGLALASGCATATPPEPPPPMERPGFEMNAMQLTDIHDGGGLVPPPATEEERADPILGSPLADDPEVQRRVNYWILRWQTWGQGYFTRYLERMERYVGHVEAEIVERGLPPSLRYLPVVESGYNPQAVSRVGAAGMWQFMSGTARFLGLDVSPLIDERRDPWRSTGVALDYLDELHDRFDGSWFLALAAYNGGWGRVERIVERHGDGAQPSDSLFWALRDRFPRETRDFVPKLLAAARLARQPEAYGFEPRGEIEPTSVEAVRVPDATSLDVVARAAGVPLEDVERLNPQILRGYTPPDRETVLRIPAGAAGRFEEAYARIPPDERVSFVEHKVRRGETLTHLSSRYAVGIDELLAANPGLDPRRLQIGQWIVVPRSPTATPGGSAEVRRVASSNASGPAAAGAGPGARDERGSATGESGDGETIHRVRPGESLWLIARRRGVGVDDLRRWNDLGPNPVLHPGDELRIRGGSTSVYRVRAGDTLSDIALEHGVRTEALLRVNDLNRGAVIQPGDEVRIPRQPGS